MTGGILVEGIAWFPSPHNHVSAGKFGILGFVCAITFSLLVLPFSAFALEPKHAEQIPHVNQQARDNFVQYIYADGHKAFAIAPGGTWAWTSGEASGQEAEINALQRCQRYTQQNCVLYASRDLIIFDKEAWPRLWRAKPSAIQPDRVKGIARGGLFPNLRFKNRQGKARSIRDFRGKITVVHFWGSWCPPCLREIPVLLRTHKTLKQQHADNVAMVLLQVREPFSNSLNWAVKNEFDALPLYDSGVKDSEDAELKTVDGKVWLDRKLAVAFPSSYVLDREGRVLFSHTGPIHNWDEYLPFFDDVVANK